MYLEKKIIKVVDTSSYSKKKKLYFRKSLVQISTGSTATCRKAYVFRPCYLISDLGKNKDGRLASCLCSHEPGTFYLSYITHVYESLYTVGNTVGKTALLNHV